MLLSLHCAPSATFNSAHLHTCSLLLMEGYHFLKVNKLEFKIKAMDSLSVTLLSEACVRTEQKRASLLSWQTSACFPEGGGRHCSWFFLTVGTRPGLRNNLFFGSDL